MDYMDLDVRCSLTGVDLALIEHSDLSSKSLSEFTQV